MKAILQNSIPKTELIGVHTVAELCGFSVPHLRRLCRSGNFPSPSRIGDNEFGWPIGTVTKWLDSRTREGTRNFERHRVLNVVDAADFLGITQDELRRISATAKGPSRTYTGQRRYGFQIGVLADWIEAQTRREGLPDGAEFYVHIIEDDPAFEWVSPQEMEEFERMVRKPRENENGA